jgi:hypothetical protein
MDAIARQPEASGKIKQLCLLQLHLLKVLVSRLYSHELKLKNSCNGWL